MWILFVCSLFFPVCVCIPWIECLIHQPYSLKTLQEPREGISKEERGLRDWVPGQCFKNGGYLDEKSIPIGKGMIAKQPLNFVYIYISHSSRIASGGFRIVITPNDFPCWSSCCHDGEVMLHVYTCIHSTPQRDRTSVSRMF